MLRIGYDASSTLSSRGGGIARYTLELLRALVALDEPDVEFVVLLNSLRGIPDRRHDFLFESPRVEVIRRQIPGPMLVEGWRRLGGPSWEMLTREQCHVVHAPASYIPSANCPVIVTVHDLGFLRDEEERSPLGGGYFRKAFPRQLPRVARVVTPSDYVARDVVQQYGLATTQVVPVASGLSGIFLQDSPPMGESRLKEFGIDRPFVLTVSDAVVRKRPWLAAEAWHVLNRRDYQMVSLGIPEKWRTPDMIALPRVTDEDLVAIYASARAVLLTTREEGFGFPLLEALSRGTPVACARHSALAEIGAEFPSYAAKENAKGFAKALEPLLNQAPEEAWKSSAREHARKFTWEQTARRMMEVYRGVGRD
jgi:glycosyltransferase involved in cell wall biosynthesis